MSVVILQVIRAFTICFCYQTTFYSWYSRKTSLNGSLCNKSTKHKLYQIFQIEAQISNLLDMRFSNGSHLAHEEGSSPSGGRVGARGCQGGCFPPKILPVPPSSPAKIFRLTSCHCIEVLHRPLTAPLVAKLAPPVPPQMKMSGSAPAGGSVVPHPHLKSVPPISCLAPRLLHTCNNVSKKCGSPCDFWLRLLQNPGDGRVTKRGIFNPWEKFAPGRNWGGKAV